MTLLERLNRAGGGFRTGGLYLAFCVVEVEQLPGSLRLFGLPGRRSAGSFHGPECIKALAGVSSRGLC